MLLQDQRTPKGSSDLGARLETPRGRVGAFCVVKIIVGRRFFAMLLLILSNLYIYIIVLVRPAATILKVPSCPRNNRTFPNSVEIYKGL